MKQQDAISLTSGSNTTTESEEIHDSDAEENNNKSVSFTNQPFIMKTASGAYEIVEESIDQVKEGSTIHRRSSTLRPPNFEPGTFQLLSAIPPPVPESLPTTPGVEITNEMYLNRKNPLEIPSQQQFTSTTTLSSSQEEDLHRGMTLKNPERNLWRVIAVCIWSFAGGLSDGAPGAILNDIEKYYGISYSIVSLIWLSNALGFILIAIVSNKLDSKLGKRKMVCGGCLTTFIMYSIVSSGTKFPAICVGFFFGGVGLATCLSQMNIFLSRFDKLSTYLGWFHGCYGIGATVAPIIAASMVNAGVMWHYYYLILLGTAAFNLVNLWLSFKHADEDLKPWDHQEVIHNGSDPNTPEDEFALTELNLGTSMENANVDYRNQAVATDIDPKYATTSQNQQKNKKLPPEPVIPKGDFKLAIKNMRTWFLTLFLFLYQGAEVSMPGWLETFLTDYRHGDPKKLGYVASGFWAGLTIGRLFLVERIHKHLGAKRGVSILALLAICFVTVGWAVDHIIIEAVMVSIAGVFVGPIYPLMITVATRVLPRKIQVISLTIMTSGGSSGGALWPFLTGLISQFSGAFVVMPMFISLFSAMIVCWFIIPNPDRATVKSPWQRLF